VKAFRGEKLSKDGSPVEPGGIGRGGGGELPVEGLVGFRVVGDRIGFESFGGGREDMLFQGLSQPLGGGQGGAAVVDEEISGGEESPGEDFQLQFLGEVPEVEKPAPVKGCKGFGDNTVGK